MMMPRRLRRALWQKFETSAHISQSSTGVDVVNLDTPGANDASHHRQIRVAAMAKMTGGSAGQVAAGRIYLVRAHEDMSIAEIEGQGTFSDDIFIPGPAFGLVNDESVVLRWNLQQITVGSEEALYFATRIFRLDGGTVNTAAMYTSAYREYQLA